VQSATFRKSDKGKHVFTVSFSPAGTVALIIAGKNLMALAAVLAEWDSGDPYMTRVQDLFGTDTGGLNGSAFLDQATVINDAAINQLFGGSGQDWFWLEGTDKVSGVKTGEVVSAR